MSRVLPSSLTSITADMLRTLCEDSTPESQTLEFKLHLPTTDDAGRSELAKDVTALANAEGGDIVFGIAEVSGTASRLRPIDSSPADTAKRRIVQTLESNVEPRLIGLQLREIPFEGGYVLVLRVPASFDGPHWFRTNGALRFVVRNGTLTSDLTHIQVRAAFDRTATLNEKARGFRARRITAIKAGMTWKPMRRGPKFVAHLVPLSSIMSRNSIDVGSLYTQSLDHIALPEWNRNYSRTLNLDGLVVYPPAINEPDVAYVQIFRTGEFEAVRFGGNLVQADQRIIPSGALSRFIAEAFTQMIGAAQGFGITGAAIIGCAIIDTDTYSFAYVGEDNFNYLRPTADRSDLVLPESLIEQLDGFTETEPLMRSTMDVFYQAFGVERWNGR